MKSPRQLSLAGNGNTTWIPHDYYQTPPAITLAGYVSSGAVLTWAVQYTVDDIGAEGRRSVVVSQATTVITVTDFGPANSGGNHGLSVGDYVSIQGTGLAGVDGEYNVATVVSATQYTVTSGTSQTVAATNAFVVTARVFTHATLTGQTGRLTGNYAFPVRGSRLVVTGFTSGVAVLQVMQGGMSS